MRAPPMMICLHRTRESLHKRIQRRVVAMFEAGWPEEVEQLLSEGLDPGAPGLQSLGYSEIVNHLVAGLPKEQAIEATQQRTLGFAKRQVTWFRRDRRLRWLDLDLLGRDGARERILGQWEACRNSR